MKKCAALVVSTLFAMGCGSKSNSPAPAPMASVPPTVSQAPAVAQTPEKSTLPPASPMPNPAQKPDATAAPEPDAIPQALKSAAYDYYGLGNRKPLDYEVTGDATGGVRTGSLTTTLKSVKDGTAYFEQVRSGGLYLLGNDELSLDSTGVHVISSTVENTDPNNIEFPENVTPGSSWKSHDKIPQAGLAFDVNTVSTVKGVQDITTKRGTLQALLITSKSEGTENGKKLRMESETYYVKGIGLAKAIIKTTVGTGQQSTLVLQLAD